MNKYNCRYRYGRLLNIGDKWEMNLEASSPKEAYEKFIKQVGIFQKEVTVDDDGLFSNSEVFDDHIDKELQKKIIEQDKLQLEEKKAEEDKKKLEEKKAEEDKKKLEEKKAEEDKKKLDQKPVPTLKPCSTCQKPLSTEAKTCPHCGQPNPTKEVLAKTEAEAEAKQEKSSNWISFFFAMIVWFGLYKLKILGKFLILPYHADPFLEKDIWIIIIFYLSFKGCKLICSDDK